MVKEKPDRVMFGLKDEVTVYLSDSTINGRIVREDMLGLTLADLHIPNKFRFIRWDAINIVEYTKKEAKNGGIKPLSIDSKRTF